MIRRVVLVRSDQKDRVDAALARLSDLRGTLGCVRDVEVGRDVGGRCLGYDRMFTLTFDTAADILRWRDHPAHQPLRSVLDSCATLLVFEYEVATAAGETVDARAAAPPTAGG